MNRKFIVAVGCFFGAIVIALLLWVTRPVVKTEPPDSAALTVQSIVAVPERVEMVVHAQGTVIPRTAADLVPEVSGTVEWVSPNLVPGGNFNVGDALLRIDARDYQDAVERTSAAVRRAEANEEHARYELNRVKELDAAELTSAAKVEASTRMLRVAEAELTDVRVALKQAERDLSRTVLYAPFAGLVASKKVDVGQYVSYGVAVAHLYASADIEVRLPIADRHLAHLNLPPLRRGEIDDSSASAVTLSAHFAGQDYTWSARLVRTEAAIDTNSRMVYAVARINSSDNDPDSHELTLPPIGLYVEAEIQGRVEDDIVVLPRTALRENNQVVVVREGKLRFQTVSVTRIYGEHVYVDGGLKQGELVCTTALQAVVDGMAVNTVPINSISTMDTAGI